MLLLKCRPAARARIQQGASACWSSIFAPQLGTLPGWRCLHSPARPSAAVPAAQAPATPRVYLSANPAACSLAGGVLVLGWVEGDEGGVAVACNGAAAGREGGRRAQQARTQASGCAPKLLFAQQHASCCCPGWQGHAHRSRAATPRNPAAAAAGSLGRQAHLPHQNWPPAWAARRPRPTGRRRGGPAGGKSRGVRGEGSSAVGGGGGRGRVQGLRPGNGTRRQPACPCPQCRRQQQRASRHA